MADADLLPLDHAPFTAANLAPLTAAFEAIGFTVSPPGAYTSPEFPEARWPNRCVFLRQGWFDLLQSAQADPTAPAGPGACLFRTSDLDAAMAAMAGLSTRPPYRLERRWDDDLGLPPETFKLSSLRERVAPLGLAVIEHVYPCPDILPAWLEHENGAVEVAGLTFGGAEPGPAAERAGAVLNLSGFEYIAASAFEGRFGPCTRQVAVRVRVGSLTQATTALGERGARCVRRGDVLLATPPPGLGCPFVFFE